MKRILGFAVVALFVAPILAGCGEETAKVDSSNPPVQVDSKAGGKKGAMENDKGLTE